MEDRKYVIDDIFKISDYIGVTNTIADGFFSLGSYTPSYGKINAMRLFFNICVKESPYNFDGDIESDIEMDELLKDEQFLKVYDAHLNSISPYKLTFGNAYKDAMDIVEARKTGINQFIDKFDYFISDLLEKVKNMFDAESISKLEKISQDISSGSFSAENITKVLGENYFN